MPIVDFDTATWTDPWVQELNPTGKLLFNYLWTNNHKNLACLYSVSIKTIANETGLTTKQVTDTLSILYPKVIWLPEDNIMWVVNHVKRQFLRTGNISPKIVQGIKTNLMAVHTSHWIIGAFLDSYGVLGIEYPYPIDTVPVGYPYPPSGGGGKGGGEGKGKGKKGRTAKRKEFKVLLCDSILLTPKQLITLNEKHGEEDMWSLLDFFNNRKADAVVVA